ncbi:hypothetical protein ACOMHN_011537 [Nucella lapillus]
MRTKRALVEWTIDSEYDSWTCLTLKYHAKPWCFSLAHSISQSVDSSGCSTAVSDLWIRIKMPPPRQFRSFLNTLYSSGKTSLDLTWSGLGLASGLIP